MATNRKMKPAAKAVEKKTTVEQVSTPTSEAVVVPMPPVVVDTTKPQASPGKITMQEIEERLRKNGYRI